MIKHKTDICCSCPYCTMIDLIIGDPLLNAWERSSIESVSRAGWFYEYTPKQKFIIERIYSAQRKKYLARSCEQNGG